MLQYVLNIGNTRAAVTEGRPVSGGAVEYYPTAQLLELWKPSAEEWRATAACVVPAVREALQKAYPWQFHFITAADYPAVDYSGYELARLGADRMANAAAAHALLPHEAVLVVDCGTALNTVAVTADGRFCGGVILPGRETALKALAAATAQLPEFAVTAPHELNPLGCNPEAGIRNGVDLGILGAAEKIIHATRKQAGFAHCRVWFTGGDAPFFTKYLPRVLHVELAPLPLTLYGVSLAAS